VIRRDALFVSLFLVACSPSGTIDDAAVGFDLTYVVSDLTVAHDLATPDLGMPVPDLVTPDPISDLSTTPDLALPDLAHPDLAQPDLRVVDMTTPLDLTLPPDLAVSNDPFDPGSCTGPALSATDAITVLASATRMKLADASLYERTRACTGATASTCGPWGTPTVMMRSLLTYSGGVVTDYKNFNMTTHLILFQASGTPKLVIRHTTDYTHSATTDTRGIVFPFGADPMVNTYPIIYVWDYAPKPNRYDDLQGLLGTKGSLHATANCARVTFDNGVSSEVVGLYRY